MDERPVRFRQAPGEWTARVGLLTVAAFVAVVPLLWMAANALKSAGETITRASANPFDPLFWPTTPLWANFGQVWLDDDFGSYFIHSTVIAGVTAAGVLVTSILAAYAFARLQFRGKEGLFSLLLATLMIPEVVTVLPNFLVVSALGWVDTLPGLTVPFMAGAFSIFLLRQFIRQIPETLFDAAQIDGASHLRIAFGLVGPLTRGPLFTIAFLEVTASWNSLQWPLLIAQTPQWRPLSVGLARFLSEVGPQIELRMAASLIALIPVVGFFLVAQGQIHETLMKSGLQE
jgi:ABC-type glycerol-3-phosphate transport system permease component